MHMRLVKKDSLNRRRVVQRIYFERIHVPYIGVCLGSYGNKRVTCHAIWRPPCVHFMYIGCMTNFFCNLHIYMWLVKAEPLNMKLGCTNDLY